jgi:hypothetical protein
MSVVIELNKIRTPKEAPATVLDSPGVVREFTQALNLCTLCGSTSIEPRSVHFVVRQIENREIRRWQIMDEDDWTRPPGVSPEFLLGRMDARSQQILVDHAHQNRELMHLRRTTEALQRSLLVLISASEKSMARATNHGGVPAPASRPKEEPDDTPSFLMKLMRHFAPKAMTWALGRIFSIALAYLLPLLLLFWAVTTKWIGFLLSWLGHALF